MAVYLNLLKPSRVLQNLSRRANQSLKYSWASSTSATTSSDGIEDYDVVIIGGGPVGLALACSLNSSDIIRQTQSIALVEASNLNKTKNWSLTADQYSNRVSSVTNTSREFLENCGAWKHVDSTRINPIEEMQVWDGVSNSRIAFQANSDLIPNSSSWMATMTENLNLQRALLNNLEEQSSLELIDKVTVSSINSATEHNWPVLTLSNGRTLRARLLIGADGFNSPVKRYTGIPSCGWAYDRSAIVATLIHAPRTPETYFQSNTTAFQRFLPTGPIAFLPLSPNISSLVWSTKPSLADALVTSEPGALVRMINAAFRLPEISIKHLHDSISKIHSSGNRVLENDIAQEIKWREASHAITEHSPLFSSNSSETIGIPPDGTHLYPPLIHSVQEGTIASFPLRFSHAEMYVGEGAGARTVLVGDAAHTIHPLAGQGLNMGLADAQSLVQAIEDAVIHGGDIGSRVALMPYAKARYFENHKMMAAVDKLHKLYSSTLPPLVWARSVGLEVINELDFVKAAIMMSAGASVSTSGHDLSSMWTVGNKVLGAATSAYDGSQFIAKGITNTAISLAENALRSLKP